MTQSPVGNSFQTRLIAAARTAAASIVVVGGRTDHALTAAAEFVTRFTAVQFSTSQLRDDVSDPLLDIRLHGDLTLLAEDLRADAAVTLTNAMSDVAAACLDPARAADVIDECRELLGLEH